jgi:hypothetical protein
VAVDTCRSDAQRVGDILSATQHGVPSVSANRETHGPIPLTPQGRRRTVFGLRSASPAHVTTWMLVAYTNAAVTRAAVSPTKLSATRREFALRRRAC